MQDSVIETVEPCSQVDNGGVTAVMEMPGFTQEFIENNINFKCCEEQERRETKDKSCGAKGNMTERSSSRREEEQQTNIFSILNHVP